MLIKSLATKRHHNKRIQEKRAKKWSHWDLKGADVQGKLRKTHFGCGCSMCKPWKHGKEPSLKPSERKKLQSED